MVVDHTSQDYNDIKTRLQEMIVIARISSLNMISDHTGIDEATITECIRDLIDEGTINGSFSPDGERFFLSNVKVSEAPIIPAMELGIQEKEVKVANTNQAKVIMVIGFAMLIIGSIIRGFTSIDIRFDNVGSAAFMLGLVAFIAGWILFSRANPPSRKI